MWPEAEAMQGTIGTGQPGNSGDISPGQPHSLELWADLCEPGSKTEGRGGMRQNTDCKSCESRWKPHDDQTLSREC